MLDRTPPHRDYYNVTKVDGEFFHVVSGNGNTTHFYIATLDCDVVEDDF